jgi:hypothetical protein
VILGDYESAAGPQITLTGNKSLSLVAGTAGGVDTGEIIAKNATITVTDSSLTLEQYIGLDLKNFTITNPDQTHLTAISHAGSVTVADSANGGKNENAADQWASISAYAYSAS